MDFLSIEKRANEAEERLNVIESKLKQGNGTVQPSVSNVGGYLDELRALREILEAAQAEQAHLEETAEEMEKENAKLRYQVLHLKRTISQQR